MTYAMRPIGASEDLKWIGEAPEGWMTAAAKRIFRQTRTPRLPEDKQLSATQKYGVIPQADFMDLEGTRLVLALSGTGNFIHVDRDDYVISLRSFQGGIERCLFSGCVSPAYTVIKPRSEIDRRYFAYLFKSQWFISSLQAVTTGIREGKNVSFDEFGNIIIPYPSYRQQEEIANFLDKELAKIDHLIRSKLKFNELLRERIVASVIDSIAPRDGWCSSPFWSIAEPKSISGQPDEGLLSVYLDRGVVPYSEGGGLVHKPAESLEKYQLVEPGDLVMNNQQAWRGSLGVSNHRGIVSPAYLIFELDRQQIDPAFANYAFRSRPYVEQFMLASMSVGDIQRQIKWPHLRRVMVSLPPLSEQKRIVQELDTRLFRLEGLISRTRMSVMFLQEKRTALITAAVTGKIDVRKAA